MFFLSLYSRFEFLGKLALPLLKMENGRKRWHALKDKKMRCRAKGSSATANPQILLEFELHWNTARAAFRTLNPKEDRHMTSTEKFKRQVTDFNTVLSGYTVTADYCRACRLCGR